MLSKGLSEQRIVSKGLHSGEKPRDNFKGLSEYVVTRIQCSALTAWKIPTLSRAVATFAITLQYIFNTACNNTCNTFSIPLAITLAIPLAIILAILLVIMLAILLAITHAIHCHNNAVKALAILLL